MPDNRNNPLQRVEAACRSLLYELQIIWYEVGETDAVRDKMLRELEEECIEVYRRKVDQANCNRAQLRQAVADSEAELAAICSAMGERPVHIRQVIAADHNTLSLREELSEILTHLEEMKKKKSDRRKQIIEVADEIQNISNEIYGPSNHTIVDDTDLSIRKLEELQRQLYALEKEKKDRLKQIHEQIDNLNSLCLVLGLDFKHTANEIHPGLIANLGSRDISNETIQFLSAGIDKLREIKLQRMQKLQDLASTVLELWNLMDTPPEEQQMFQNVTCNIAASEHEITQPNSLTEDFINHMELLDIQFAAEVSRLEGLKASRMKELVLKKRSELEEMCRKTHMLPEVDGSVDDTVKVIDSGIVDPVSVLEEIEVQIANVKEEAFTRKEILEKVEKWLAACEEESWLEDYNNDENRYNAGRGSHLNLKRAEKARKLVSKLPGMEETLASKIMTWEKERGIEFVYDGVCLLSMVEDSSNLRQQKDEERRRQREAKKLQGQMIAEQEALYGPRSSPSKPQSAKKSTNVSSSSPSYKSLSGGGTSSRLDSPVSKKTMSRSRSSKKVDIICHNSPEDDSSSILSTGRRACNNSELAVGRQSLNSVNVTEPESTLLRKPFLPITSKASSKVNMSKYSKSTHVDTSKTVPDKY